MILYGNEITYLSKDNQKILDHVHIEVDEGQRVGIVGANGSGKTTLLKNLVGLSHPSKGKIELKDKEIMSYDKEELAREIGIMHQLNDFHFDFTVKEMIEMGRYPYLNGKLFLDMTDQEIVTNTLQLLQLSHKQNELFSRLSGGEKQRVLLGRALVQQPSLLVLDEPTNHLDMYQQQEILRLIKELDISTLCVLHDLGLAYEFCDVVYMLKEGVVCHFGLTEEVLTPKNIYDCFNIKVDIISSNKSTKKFLVVL